MDEFNLNMRKQNFTEHNASPYSKEASQDPIARNKKDIDRPEEPVQSTQISRSYANMSKAIERMNTSSVGDNRDVPVSNETTHMLSGQSWSVRQNMQTPPPSMSELIMNMLRFKWTLLIIFILVSAPLIVVIWTQVIPTYRAKGEIRIRPRIPRLVFNTDDNGAIPFYNSFVNTQVSVMRSFTVLQRVLDQPEIQQTQWYKNSPKTMMQRLRKDQTSPLERLRDGLSVRPRAKTEIVDVSFVDASGQEARSIVDTVLEQYIKFSSEASNATEEVLYRQLGDQYKKLESEIQGREKIATGLRRSLGTENPQELVSSRRFRLDETEARLIALQQRLTLLQWEIKQTTGNDSNGVPVAQGDNNIKQMEYYNDSEWRQFNIQVRTIQHQQDNSIYAEGHLETRRLKNDLAFAQELLQERETHLDEQWQDLQKNTNDLPITAWVLGKPNVGQETVSLEHQYNLAKQEEPLLVAEFEKQRTELKSLFESTQLYETENNALRHTRELFDAVRQRLDQKRVERVVSGSIEVLTSAFVPLRPGNDRRMVFTMMALFSALGLSGGVAYLRAVKNQMIYTPTDMPLPIQTPFLGCIPVSESKGAPDFEGDPVLLESIRSIRTSFYSRLKGQICPIVMVTSATKGTGKSSLSMMLGKSMAQTGKKVLLIDCDIYKRSLSRQFDVEDQPGFIESLQANAIDKEHIIPTKTYGLDIMSTGLRGNDQTAFEEIAGSAFKELMNQILKQYTYDIVLLDGPPILAMADASIIARQIDGVIMVEREHVSHRINVADALIRLNATGGHLLGTVFVGSLRGKHYGYGYGYGAGAGAGYGSVETGQRPFSTEPAQ